jgi:hypothetical protein
MIGVTQFQSDSVEMYDPEWQQLRQENGFLRAIIAELLIKNQKLRWELLGQRSEPVHDPRALMTSDGIPLCRNPLIAGMP